MKNGVAFTKARMDERLEAAGSAVFWKLPLTRM
jgi:hypothetical protein